MGKSIITWEYDGFDRITLELTAKSGPFGNFRNFRNEGCNLDLNHVR